MLLPTPSPRNLDIFSAIEDRGQSLRAVAEEHGLSPARVGEIVQQVQRWYAANTPAWAAELDPATRALLAFRRHDDRLKVLYDGMLRGYESVQANIRESGAQVRFLTGAMRLSRERFVATLSLSKIRTPEVPHEAPIAPPVGVLAREDVEQMDEELVAPQAAVAKPELVVASTNSVAPISSVNSTREPCAAPWRAAQTTSINDSEEAAEFAAILAQAGSTHRPPPTFEAPRKSKKERRAQRMQAAR
jgi:hypothetical protein